MGRRHKGAFRGAGNARQLYLSGSCMAACPCNNSPSSMLMIRALYCLHNNSTKKMTFLWIVLKHCCVCSLPRSCAGTSKRPRQSIPYLSDTSGTFHSLSAYHFHLPSTRNSNGPAQWPCLTVGFKTIQGHASVCPGPVIKNAYFVCFTACTVSRN